MWSTWVLALGGVTLALLAMRSRLDKAHIALAFLLTVLGASAAGGRALGLAIAGTAFLIFNYLFLEPYYTFVIADPFDWIVLVAFLATSIVAAQLLYRATATAEAATQRAEELDQLAALGAETLSAPSATQALEAIVDVIRMRIDVETCEVYRRRIDGVLVCAAVGRRTLDADGAGATLSAAEADTDPRLQARAGDVARADGLLPWLGDSGGGAVELWDGTVRLLAADSGWSPGDAQLQRLPSTEFTALLGSLQSLTPESAGSAFGRLRTAIRPASLAIRALLIPLIVREHSVGVLRLTSSGHLTLTPEQARVLLALAYYAALGVERVRLVEDAERAESERRLEVLRSALLTAVSHDLRTPLTTIKAIAHEITQGGDRSSATTIELEADRLDALIADLLDISRINAGAVGLTIAINTVDELVGAALNRAAGRLKGRSVHVDLASREMIAGYFDFTQTLRILVNLLENSAKYTPTETPIEVRAHRDGNRLHIVVLDRGPGIPAAERQRIFEPFYQLPGTPPDVGGTGLGLSIARGLAEAQGGTLEYEPRPGGGSMFVISLPAASDVPADTQTAE